MKSIYLKGVVGYDFDEDSIREKINPDSSEKLRVYINSPGGDVLEGFSIYNLFKTYKGKVETVIAPYAASAASYIAMSGDEISGFKNSVFMAHRAWGLVIGNANDLKTSAEIFDAFDSIIAESYSGRMGKNKDEVLKMLDSEMWLIGWEKLTDAGMLDTVLDSQDEVPEEVKKEITEEEPDAETAKNNRKKEEDFISKCLASRQGKNNSERLTRLAAMCIKPQNQMPDTPADDIKSNKEDFMAKSLKELLDANPEVKAEYDANLQAANTDRDKAVESDRKRIADILNYSGVKLSDEAIDAIESGKEAKDFAADELQRERGKREDKKDSPFGKLSAKQVPGEQDSGGKAEASGGTEFDEKKAETGVKNLFNSRRGE